MSERIPQDAYMTPPDLALAICKRLGETRHMFGTRILEPSAGTGNFVRAAQTVWPGATVTALEVDPVRAQQSGAWCGDALSLPSSHDFALVLGNPPFLLAEEFVEWAHEQIIPGGIIAFLLKLSFLTGKGRAEKLYSRFALQELHPIVGRAAFIPDSTSTDNHEYGVFVWDPDSRMNQGFLYPHLHWKKD